MQESLRLAMKSHTMTLAPTPIGDAHSPVQSYLLRNGGPAAVPFSLDVNPLARMTAENYGFEVTFCFEAGRATCSPGCLYSTGCRCFTGGTTLACSPGVQRQ